MQISSTKYMAPRIASTPRSRPVENQTDRSPVISDSYSYSATELFQEVGEGLRQTIPLAMAVGLEFGSVTASAAGLTGLATALRVGAGVTGLVGVPAAALPMAMASSMPGVQLGAALGSIGSIAAAGYLLLS